MTASAWIAMGALGVALLVHAVAAAFTAGKHSQRITNLERSIGDSNALNNMVIELRVKMEHVETQMLKQSATLEGVNRQLANIAMGRMGSSGEIK